MKAKDLFLTFTTLSLFIACGSEDVIIPEKQNSIEFIKDFPGLLSFKFSQSSVRIESIQPYEVKLIIDKLSEEIPGNIEFEIFGFSDDIIKVENLDYSYAGGASEFPSESHLITENAKKLLSESNLVVGLTSIENSPIEIQGSYSGELKVFGDDSSTDLPKEILPIRGFITFNGQVFLLNLSDNNLFDFISGYYSSDNKFVGKFEGGTNNTQRILSSSSTSFSSSSDEGFMDRLNVDGQTDQIQITLTKK